MSICYWTSMDEKVLFIPDPNTGPCKDSLFGLTIKGRCGPDPLNIGGTCGAVFFTTRVDSYDSSGNITEGVTSLPCTDTGIGANCGEHSQEKTICLDPPHPGSFPIVSWQDGHYRIVIDFYDVNLGSDCEEGAWFDQLVAYVWRDFGSWSTTDNPFP